METLMSQVTSIENQLHDKSIAIEKLSQEIAQKGNENSLKQSQGLEDSNRIKALTQQKTDLTAQLNKLNTQKRDLQNQKKTLDDKINNPDNLNKILKQIQEVEAQIQNVVFSGNQSKDTEMSNATQEKNNLQKKIRR